jgi:hypothetical protein
MPPDPPPTPTPTPTPTPSPTPTPTPHEELVPKFEQWGRKGDWAWGTPDGSYSTKMLSAARRIRTAMS